MAKQRQGGLGRGLGALIPTEPATPVEQSPLRDLPVSDIVPNTYQPRQTFDEEALEALTASVRELGVLQPVLVRRTDSGQFELIAGERRWRAATRAGLDLIPAIVRDVDNETSLAQAIVENVQRAELNAIEEAAAFQQLIDDFDFTQEQVASRVGRSRPAIANSLRLLQLPVTIQGLIVEGRLSAGHGRVLVSVDQAERGTLVSQILDRMSETSDTPNPVERSESLPVPGLPEDWHVLATNKIVSTVDNVRVKTSGPAIKVSRAVVFGLLGAFIALIAVIVFLIGAFRGLNNALPYDVWFVYLILGAIFMAAGAFLWSKRPKRAAS